MKIHIFFEQKKIIGLAIFLVIGLIFEKFLPIDFISFLIISLVVYFLIVFFFPSKEVKKYKIIPGMKCIDTENITNMLRRRIIYLDFNSPKDDSTVDLCTGVIKNFLDNNEIILLLDDRYLENTVLTYQACIFEDSIYEKLLKSSFEDQCGYFGLDKYGSSLYEPEPHW